MTCGFGGCDRPHHVGGLCKEHDQQRRRGKPLAPLPPPPPRRGCSEPGCDRPHHARGFCRRHAPQWRRPGRPRACTFPGCDRKHHARGFCHAHYRRLARVGGPRPPAPESCTFQGCDRPHHARGYCFAHYRQLRRDRTPGALRAPAPESCTFPGCGRPHAAKGLCKSHYQQLWSGSELKPIDPAAIARATRPEGAVALVKRVAREIVTPDGTVCQAELARRTGLHPRTVDRAIRQLRDSGPGGWPYERAFCRKYPREAIYTARSLARAGNTVREIAACLELAGHPVPSRYYLGEIVWRERRCSGRRRRGA